MDDNSRALIMSLMAWQQSKDEDALALMPVYLSFINYMQCEDGNFRNFLSFSRQFLDEYGSEDSFGRTIWALGFLIRYAPNDSFKQIGREIFFNSVIHFKKLESIRGAANTIIGISFYLKESPNDERMLQMLRAMSKKLKEAFRHSSADNWTWFEDKMAKDW